MNSTKFFVRVLMVAATLTAPARADVLRGFSIENINVTPDGAVGLTLNSGTVWRTSWICSLSAGTNVNDGYASKTVTADTCRELYSEALTLKSSHTP